MSRRLGAIAPTGRAGVVHPGERGSARDGVDVVAGRPGARTARRRPWRRVERTRPAAGAAMLGEVAGALRVGAAPALAWERVGVPTGPDGVPEPDAVVVTTGLAPAHARAVVAACRLAAELGAPSAVLLEQVTLAVVRDAEAQDRRRAALAGPRATARLLAWLPAGGLGLGHALGADPLAVLLRPGAGTLLLVTGAALAVTGQRWTAREVRAAVRAGEAGP